MKKDMNIFYWLRLANEMTREEVADKLQISVSSLCAIENGGKVPSKRVIRAYANLFDINEKIITEFSKKKMTIIKKFLLSLLKKIAV